jgi:hypothetical protein
MTLLPCPFRGCVATKEKRRHTEWNAGGIGDYDFFVYGCDNCKIYKKSKKEWNTRVSHQSLVDALEEVVKLKGQRYHYEGVTFPAIPNEIILKCEEALSKARQGETV